MPTIAPPSNAPLSEQFRLLAKQYVKLDAVARRMEESKTAELARRVKAKGDMPVTSAERDVKSDQDWQDYIDAMLNARTAANELRYEMEAMKMQHAENQSFEASKRAEMRL